MGIPLITEGKEEGISFKHFQLLLFCIMSSRLKNYINFESSPTIKLKILYKANSTLLRYYSNKEKKKSNHLTHRGKYANSHMHTWWVFCLWWCLWWCLCLRETGYTAILERSLYYSSLSPLLMCFLPHGQDATAKLHVSSSPARPYRQQLPVPGAYPPPC